MFIERDRVSEKKRKKKALDDYSLTGIPTAESYGESRFYRLIT
jgi:hypothetical protein